MALTTGYAVDCANGGCSGGIVRIYLANKQDLDDTVGVNGFTEGTQGIFTAVTMLLAKVFYEVVPVRFSASFNESGAQGENNCTYAYTQDIAFTMPCTQDVDSRNFIEDMQGQNCCGMVAIVEYTDGNYKAVGYLTNQFVTMSASEATSGAALTDANQVVVTLQTVAVEPARVFTGTVPV